MITKIRYELRKYFDDKQYTTLYTSESELALKKAANDTQSNYAEEYKIVSVITTETVLDIFTVPAYGPDWETVAQDMSCVYAGSIDWQDNDYLALSEEDRHKVEEYIGNETGECEHCGWTFEEGYLSDTSHGRICDRCESNLEEGEENDC